MPFLKKKKEKRKEREVESLGNVHVSPITLAKINLRMQNENSTSFEAIFIKYITQISKCFQTLEFNNTFFIYKIYKMRP